MAKRAFIIHSWEAHPDDDWYPWLQDELEQRGYEVSIPEMPNPEAPEISQWVSALDSVVGESDEDTLFVGHSIGCQTIMRYLASKKAPVCGRIIFVAGWFTLQNLEDEETEEIARPWIDEPIDFDKVQDAADSIIVINSDNDEFVPLEENRIMFEERLGAEVVIDSHKGHFNSDDGVVEVPRILDFIR